MTASALYTGTVRHRRFAVREHEFSYALRLAYLDLDELPGLLGGRVARRLPGSDDLAAQVRALVAFRP